MNTLLSIKEVSVTLAKRKVVRDFSLQAKAGDFIALVGPNGAGKTSLLRAIAGLLPYCGEVKLDTLSLHAMPAELRARSIAFMPQNGTLAWPMPVRDVVAIGRLPHEGTALASHDEKAIANAVAACGLSEMAQQNTDHLSGGERVRVLLARSLAVEARILLLDEPVASLDPAWQLQVMDLLKAQADAGHIVICVLHDLALAMRCATRMVVMREGELRGDDQPQALIPCLREAFDLDFGLLETEHGPVLHAHRKEPLSA
jgi:iron complex transport system ATP-binding protein